MTSDTSVTRLKIQELQGRIMARLRLAEQASDRAWHLRYVEIYRSEVQELQAGLQETNDKAAPEMHERAAHDRP